MDVQEDILIGYKCEFMPNDIEILLIGDDISLKGEESKYRKLVKDINMYDVKFIDELDRADPAIKVKSQFLVRTDRCPRERGQGFARLVSGLVGGHWKPNHGPAEIKNQAGGVIGYKRELVLYTGGQDGEKEVNSHVTMREYYYKSEVVKKETLICTVSYEDSTIRKQLSILKTGVEAARSLRMKARAPRRLVMKQDEPGTQKMTATEKVELCLGQRNNQGGVSIRDLSNDGEEQQVPVLHSRLAKARGFKQVTHDDKGDEEFGEDS